MADDHAKTYEFRASGLWAPVHRVSLSGKGEIGRLRVARNRWGLIVGGTFDPEKGEVLHVRRDPGLLRSQFSLWTEDREWLGSSLRWSFLRREIVLHTGSRPLRVLPLPGFSFGWTLVAPKTGEMARMRGNPLTRRTTVEVHRRLELETVIFAYFLGSMILRESLWPGPHVEVPMAAAGKTPKAVG